jgi:hypothetical protein
MQRRNGLGGLGVAHLVLLAFLSLCLATATAIALDHVSWTLVLPLTLVLLALLAPWLPRPEPQRGDRVAALAAVGLAVIWVVVNLPYTAQMFLVTHDPAIYTVLGAWLSHHPAAVIDVGDAVRAVEGLPGFSADLGAFPVQSGTTHVPLQGGSLLPGLMGLAGRLGGQDALLATNLVIGGVGLVATYLLARLVVRPWLALLAEITLALSLPWLFFSREPYSETLVLIAVAGGLAWLVSGLREERVSLMAVAGLFLGTATFARVDGPLAFAGPVAVLAVAALLLPRSALPQVLMRGTTATLITALGGAIVGFWTLQKLTPDYVSTLASQIRIMLLVTVATIVLATVCLPLRTWLGDRLALSPRWQRRLGWVAGAVVVVFFAVLWSRPWWQQSRSGLDLPYQHVVAATQEAEGLPVDESRTYDEYTLRWVSWYFGPVTVVLATAGLALMAGMGIARRRLSLLLIAGATLSVGLVYFVRVSITPYQLWAFRRLLPIIVPGMLVGAFYALHVLSADRRRVLRLGVTPVLSLAVVLAPLLAWSHLVRVPNRDGTAAFFNRLCERIDHRPVLLPGTALPNTQLPIRTVCDVPVVTGVPTDPEAYRALEERLPDLVTVVFSPDSLPAAAPLPEADPQGTIRMWPWRLMSVPRDVDTTRFQAWVGTIDDRGRFVAE